MQHEYIRTAPHWFIASSFWVESSMQVSQEHRTDNRYTPTAPTEDLLSEGILENEPERRIWIHLQVKVQKRSQSQVVTFQNLVMPRSGKERHHSDSI